jgi:acetolactate synthase-1/2/3 large subunit
MNNKQHGMVAQFQEQNTPGRFFFTRENYSTPNFVKISKAYGIKSKRITHKTKLKKIIKLIERHGKQPLVLEVCIPTEAKALPKMNW